MSNNCRHPTCFDSPTCRREKKSKKVYQLKRTPIKKRAYKIRPFSLKRQDINKEYSKKSKDWLSTRPFCRIQSPVCTKHATCVNHTKGKDTTELLLDENFWEEACWPCNGYIEDNHAWAEKNGHKISKHKK